MHSLKIIGQHSTKKVLGPLFLIFTSLMIAGCSVNGAESEKAADESEQAIQAIIEKEFNGPDEKYNKLWDAAMEAQISEQYSEDYEAYLQSPEYQALMSYTEEIYASYFTENGYDNFVNQAAAFMYSTFDGDYELNTSAIEIAQNENETTLYDFTFQVDYTDENGETSQFNFEGNAIAPQEGKIGKIEYTDADQLLQQLRNNE